MIIKQLVNSTALWDSFCKELDERLDFSYRQLSQRDEPSEMYRIQGEIRALNSLKKLRDKVNSTTVNTDYNKTIRATENF